MQSKEPAANPTTDHHPSSDPMDTPTAQSPSDTISPPHDQPDQDDQIKDLKDALMRALAENENLRKRTQREKDDMAKYAITAFAKDLLNVADNLGRALNVLKPDDQDVSPTLNALATGVQMTDKELISIFERHGIKKIHPHGSLFDPAFHQAVFEVEDPSHPKGTIVEILQPGYILHDRLLRPAMVGVAK